MAQADDRADLREIRANVQKLDDELDSVRLSLVELAAQVSLGQAESKRSHEATAKVLLEMDTKLSRHVEPSLIGTVASAVANPKVLGQVLLIVSTIGGLVAGTGYATAKATAEPVIPVPVVVPLTTPMTTPMVAPIPPGELIPPLNEQDTDHASIP